MSKLIVGTNDLQTMFPLVAAEWHPTKNGDLSPSDFAHGSEKRVWWKCSNGHEWEATINYRTYRGSGCPYCSGHRVIKGKNDFQTQYPDIAKEWHPNKNGDLKPTEIKSWSNKKVWWECANKHSYQSTVGNRVKGKGCPYCSGQRTLAGFNDFKTWCSSNNREDLLYEWNYQRNDVDPSEISPQNNKKMWWRCSLGHEWDASIGSRTSGRPSGCPYCSNPPKRILIGFNDFETWCNNNKKEYLLKEWDYDKNTEFAPTDISFGCGKRVWWRCNRGHEWCVSPGNRVQGTGCPICSRTQTSFPEQAIAYYVSKTFSIIQRYQDKGFEIDVFLEDYDVGIEYDGLFYHTDSGRRRETEKEAFYKGKNITILRIKESKTKSGLEGNTIFFIPKRKNYINDNFNTMIYSLLALLEQITGIPVNNDVDIVRDELSIREQYASIIKENSVAVVYPELIPEWDVKKNNGMTPDNFSANANIKVWWKCINGHSWKAVISSRGRRKLGCPYCSGLRTVTGETDLESWCNENNPELIKEWNRIRNNFLPSEVSKTSNKKVWWQCAKCGNEWEAVIANRVHGTGCPVCNTCNVETRGSVSLAEWCRDSNHIDLLNEWNYELNGNLKPDDVSRGSHRIVWWKCTNGHVWKAQIKSRTYNHGCPYCSGTYKKVLVGTNDLVTWCKENNKQYILDEWNYSANGALKPEMFTFGSHKLIHWKCINGHEWTSVIKARTRHQGNVCPVCAINKEYNS